MDGTKICFCLLSVAVFLTVGIEAQRCKECGDSGHCCKHDEICETKVNGGTCYKAADKVTCNFLYYCYKPTTCCGFGSCCPENSQCCGNECCGSGYRCNGAFCEIKSSSYSSYTFRWYYVLFVILPLIAVCGAVGRRMRYRRAPADSGRIILRNDFQPDSASPANPVTVSATTFAPPSSYEDIVTNTGVPNSFDSDANQAKIPKPPSYSEVVSQPFQYSGTSEQSAESVDPNQGTAGTVNPGFETEPSGNRASRT